MRRSPCCPNRATTVSNETTRTAFHALDSLACSVTDSEHPVRIHQEIKGVFQFVAESRHFRIQPIAPMPSQAHFIGRKKLRIKIGTTDEQPAIELRAHVAVRKTGRPVGPAYRRKHFGVRQRPPQQPDTWTPLPPEIRIVVEAKTGGHRQDIRCPEFVLQEDAKDGQVLVDRAGDFVDVYGFAAPFGASRQAVPLSHSYGLLRFSGDRFLVIHALARILPVVLVMVPVAVKAHQQVRLFRLIPVQPVNQVLVVLFCFAFAVLVGAITPVPSGIQPHFGTIGQGVAGVRHNLLRIPIPVCPVRVILVSRSLDMTAADEVIEPIHLPTVLEARVTGFVAAATDIDPGARVKRASAGNDVDDPAHRVGAVERRSRPP